MTGYDIKQYVESVFSYFYNASFGTIYPMLGKMEKEQLITKESVIQDGKPNKNLYTITAEGKRRFQAYLESEMQLDELKSDFSMRMYFSDLADQDLTVRWLTDRIRLAEEKLDRLHADYDRWKDHMNTAQEICIRMGIEHNEMQKRLLTEGLEQIQATASEKE